MKYTLIIIAMCILSIKINAQKIPIPTPTNTNLVSSPPDSRHLVTDSNNSTNKPQSVLASSPVEVGIQINWEQYVLPMGVLIFGMIIVLVLMFLYFKTPDFTSDHAIRIISIALIITGLLFIVSLSASALTAQSINNLNAPAFGLLGTMAGYLLAKSRDVNQTDNSSNEVSISNGGNPKTQSN